MNSFNSFIRNYEEAKVELILTVWPLRRVNKRLKGQLEFFRLAYLAPQAGLEPATL